jgi:hypothetical protein
MPIPNTQFKSTELGLVEIKMRLWVLMRPETMNDLVGKGRK